MKYKIEKHYIKDSGTFPNSGLPAIHYIGILQLPLLFPAAHIKQLFRTNGWTNNWRDGIYTYDHYHSVTHEVMGVCKGETILQLGGENGTKIKIRKGDVVIIPAGVAHKNLGEERQVICVGGYPDGKDFDMNYGKAGERPQTDINIAALPVPESVPVLGRHKGLYEIWE